MSKNILIINANPKSKSLCKSLSETYAKAVEGQNQVRVIHLHDLEFKINLEEGYDQNIPLEEDLELFQQHLAWSQHIVIISPVWWGSMPAKFKGLIDRTFLSGFAFKYEKGKTIPKKLLKGRTSEMIITLDTPPLWYRWVQGNVIYHQLKKTILSFSGINNTSTIYFGPVISAKKEQIDDWFTKTQKLAQKH
ncbi:NAD(P)H-dependent oxidoreductase [Vibrio sp. HN007]|uniref:NAD(P)H-dependent oxidoreductase n=1 Tax=Vibrio iocasae TaxID=3098914 RepID=UPI0035D43904